MELLTDEEFAACQYAVLHCNDDDLVIEGGVARRLVNEVERLRGTLAEFLRLNHELHRVAGEYDVAITIATSTPAK